MEGQTSEPNTKIQKFSFWYVCQNNYNIFSENLLVYVFMLLERFSVCIYDAYIRLAQDQDIFIHV